MTNNELTDGVIDVWFNAAKAAIHHPATTRSEHSHAFAAYMLAQEVKRLHTELQERRKADGELVAFFSYGSEHCFEHHKTAQDAIKAAEAAIDDYRGDAGDGWSEEVDSICWGVIMQASTKVGERPRTEDDCCDPACETVCDYALLPEVMIHE